MRNLLIGLLAIIVAALGGCGADEVLSESNAADQPDYNEVEVVQFPSTHTVLINDIHYEVTEKSHLFTVSEEEIEPETLKAGDLVELTHSPQPIDHSSTDQETILSLKLYDDEKSRSISKAIAHVMENQEIGVISSPQIKSVSQQLVTLQFNDIKNRQKFECIVNTQSLQFHIKKVNQAYTKKQP
ncbi:hypothetical protein [Planococcus salinus]|uniref:DUF3221 domain-containing protein n=1 Tax=Planococcus salinus TaxID=1848460 RepID=A0A3M8PA93_9BACL|nr:hypothetical protein [Planococcus salinus]RNF40160.1 hypothetical protein EEX84_05845 [Planococcus salinus]